MSDLYPFPARRATIGKGKNSSDDEAHHCGYG